MFTYTKIPRHVLKFNYAGFDYILPRDSVLYTARFGPQITVYLKGGSEVDFNDEALADAIEKSMLTGCQSLEQEPSAAPMPFG